MLHKTPFLKVLPLLAVAFLSFQASAAEEVDDNILEPSVVAKKSKPTPDNPIVDEEGSVPAENALEDAPVKAESKLEAIKKAEAPASVVIPVKDTKPTMGNPIVDPEEDAVSQTVEVKTPKEEPRIEPVKAEKSKYTVTKPSIDNPIVDEEVEIKPEPKAEPKHEPVPVAKQEKEDVVKPAAAEVKAPVVESFKKPTPDNPIVEEQEDIMPMQQQNTPAPEPVKKKPEVQEKTPKPVTEEIVPQEQPVEVKQETKPEERYELQKKENETLPQAEKPVVAPVEHRLSDDEVQRQDRMLSRSGRRKMEIESNSEKLEKIREADRKRKLRTKTRLTASPDLPAGVTTSR